MKKLVLIGNQKIVCNLTDGRALTLYPGDVIEASDKDFDTLMLTGLFAEPEQKIEINVPVAQPKNKKSIKGDATNDHSTRD